MTHHATTSAPTTAASRDDERRGLRRAGGVLLLGGILFFAGVSRPVVTDWANAWGDSDTQLALARAASGEFTVGFVLMGLGYAVMGIGAGMLLLAMRPLFTGRKAQIAQVFGWVGVVGGLLVGGERTVMTLVDYEWEAVNQGTPIGILGTLGLGLAFFACGLLTWNGPIWRWPSLVFALAGLLGMPTIPAVFMFAALGYGVLVVIQFRRGHVPQVR